MGDCDVHSAMVGCFQGVMLVAIDYDGRRAVTVLTKATAVLFNSANVEGEMIKHYSPGQLSTSRKAVRRLYISLSAAREMGS
jgi:hypothetical protein